MPLNFTDLIPDTKTKRPPLPRRGTIDFEDLVPKEQRVVYPSATPETIAAARQVVTAPVKKPFKAIGLDKLRAAFQQRRGLEPPPITPAEKEYTYFTKENVPQLGLGLPSLSSEDVKKTHQTLEGSYSDFNGIVLYKGKPVDEFEFDRMQAQVRSNPQYFSDLHKRQLAMIENSLHPLTKELPRKLKWLSTSLAARIPGFARMLGAPNLRQDLAEEAKEFPGWSGQLAENAADAGWFYIKYLMLLPKVIGAGKEKLAALKNLPRVKKVIGNIEKAGGVKWLAERFPRTVGAIESATETFGLTAGIVGPIEAVEAWGENKTLEQAWPEIRNHTLIYAGITTAFDVGSSIDRAWYIKRLKAQLRKTTALRYKSQGDALAARLKAGERVGDSIKGLADSKRLAYKTIDKLCSNLEAEMAGVSRGDVYKQNELVRESALRSAEKFARFGPEAMRVTPKGYRPYMPKEAPTIGKQLPTTRTAEIISSVREWAKPRPTARPSYAAKAGLMPGAKIPTPPRAEVPMGAPMEIAKRRAVEILPRKSEILSEIKEAISKAPAAKDYDMKGKPTVHFEINGGMNVLDNKEALRQAYGKVNALPVKEFWPAKPTKAAVPKPVAAKKEKIGELHKTPEGYFTDGRLLIKGTPPAKAKYDEGARTLSEQELQELLTKETQPAEFEHYAVSSPDVKGISQTPIKAVKALSYPYEPDRPLAVFKSEGKYYSYNQDIFNAVRNRFPDARYGVVPDSGQLVAYKADEPVATLMPVTVREMGEDIEVVGADRPPVELGAAPEAITPAEPTITEAKPAVEGKVITEGLDPADTFKLVEAEKEFNKRLAEGDIQGAGNVVGVLRDRAFEGAGKDNIISRRFNEAADKLESQIAVAAKPAVEFKDADENRSRLVDKWGEEKFDEMFFDLAESGRDEQFERLDSAVAKLDEQGKFDSPEAHKLRIQLDAIVERELEKPTEEPSMFVPQKGRLDFEDLIPEKVGPEPEDIKSIVVDTFREWPKGIKRVGGDYWVEVMAASKKLLTPYRYTALRKTMLGVFRRKALKGEIEVQDVRDALTATHELGHNFDWLLSNKTLPSSIKGRFPATTAKEGELRVELKRVSQVIRPDLWERAKTSKAQNAYVNRHSELMADFISHYILDPEATRKLAPDVTRLFEAKIADRPEIHSAISVLQESRYENVEPPVAEHIRDTFPLPKEFTPLRLSISMMDEGYVKAAESLGITAARHYKLLIARSEIEAHRINKLVPNKDRQTDLVVIAENGSKNPWTGKTQQEILAEGLSKDEKKAIDLFRGYQELARQTVNKYLRGAEIAEYIKFIEDYFVHAYSTPMTEKYKTAIHKWAKKSPQARKRILPDLAAAVELGLKPRAKTLSDGLRLWAGMNYRVMTNKAFLKMLPQITNDDGISILQKPKDYPAWPTVDYWPIRQTYAVPLKGRGILLFQGRVAIDPRVKPFVDAMFGRRVFNTPVRVIEGLNAIWKAFELTLCSFFHHQAEFFSACGSLGPRALPFFGGYYGKRAQVFGKKKLFGFLPEHIGVLKAGKELEKCPEFMEDYMAHGGQRGYISTEGINLMERMLKGVEDFLKNIIQTKPVAGKAVWIPYVPAMTARATYSWFQHLLWDNVNRAKLVTYYKLVSEGAKNSNLPMKDIKELSVQYINDNYGGQEFLNTMFRDPKTRQFWTQVMMSLDWTFSQIKTARWPFGIGEKSAARRAFMRKIGRHHWFWYLAAVASATIAGSYAMSGKGPWENELGHRLNADWTKLWRKAQKIWAKSTGQPTWKERGDYSRRYISVGKAGRELARWVTSPLGAFGNKLSPVGRTVFEQGTGYNLGHSFPEPWAKEDLELYQEVYARFGHLMKNFEPFSLSGNNAFLAFPSRKGMTHWRAVRSYEKIFNVKANIACGGLTAALTKASHILDRNTASLNRDIIRACELNNVDWEQALRGALANSRSRYYRRFWSAAKQQDVKLCNRYADALLALGTTQNGFVDSLIRRSRQLSKESGRTAIKAFIERQKAGKANE